MKFDLFVITDMFVFILVTFNFVFTIPCFFLHFWTDFFSLLVWGSYVHSLLLEFIYVFLMPLLSLLYSCLELMRICYLFSNETDLLPAFTSLSFLFPLLLPVLKSCKYFSCRLLIFLKVSIYGFFCLFGFL